MELRPAWSPAGRSLSPDAPLPAPSAGTSFMAGAGASGQSRGIRGNGRAPSFPSSLQAARWPARASAAPPSSLPLHRYLLRAHSGFTSSTKGCHPRVSVLRSRPGSSGSQAGLIILGSVCANVPPPPPDEKDVPWGSQILFGSRPWLGGSAKWPA